MADGLGQALGPPLGIKPTLHERRQPLERGGVEVRIARNRRQERNRVDGLRGLSEDRADLRGRNPLGKQFARAPVA